MKAIEEAEAIDIKSWKVDMPTFRLPFDSLLFNATSLHFNSILRLRLKSGEKESNGCSTKRKRNFKQLGTEAGRLGTGRRDARHTTGRDFALRTTCRPVMRVVL